MFEAALKWTGCTPDVALDTPIVQLEAWIKARIAFVRDTWPWGQEKDKDKELLERAPSPELAQQNLLDWARRMKRQQSKKVKTG